MKEDIERIVAESVENIRVKVGLDDLNLMVDVDVPKRKEFGDFSVNTAMILAKRMGENSRRTAELIIENLPEEKNSLFKKIEIAGAGFINFFVKEQAIVNKLNEIDSLGEEFGYIDIGKNKKVLVEFVSANPTGYLHMGHARNAVVGDTISSLLKATGHQITREFYINDAGRQIRLLGQSVYARYKEFVGEESQIPEDGYKGDYIRKIAKAINDEKGNGLLKDMTEEDALSYSRNYASSTLLEGINIDLKRIGVYFDEWYSELDKIHSPYLNAEDKTRLDRTKDQLERKGALENKDGALWFKASEYGDSQDWVMVKSDGSPTYFLADIAYHCDKLERGYQNLINVWGADHHGHVSRLKAALRALGYDDSKLNVVLIQFVRLMENGKEVPMSKRAGSYVTMRDVINEVGADVTRYFLLMRSSESHLDFDLGLARKESSENPVYYIQYAYVRINSIFRKAKEVDLHPLASSLNLLRDSQEIELIKKLLLFPKAVEEGALRLAPHKVAYYLQEIAADFHVYYNKCRIVNENQALSSARLHLVKCVRIVLSNGLRLLGISTPEEM